MHESTNDVRRDIEETRARITATLGDLETEVDSRKAAVTDRIEAARDRVVAVREGAQSSITNFAREHPWYALGTAVGIGLVLGRSGAAESAARRTAEAAQRAAGATAGATAGAARTGVEKAKGLVHRGNGPGAGGSTADSGAHGLAHDPQQGAIGGSAADVGRGEGNDAGVVYRLKTGFVEAIGGDVLLDDMRREAARIG